MYKLNEILRAVGRIEGRLDEYHKLNDRVSSLERWQSWLKGGWAVPVGATRTSSDRPRVAGIVRRP